MSSSRREFLAIMTAAGAAFSIERWALAADTAPNQTEAAMAPPEGVRKGDMIYRALGKTGEWVSLIGLGGSHIGQLPEEEDSIRLIRSAIDQGITFMDNSWDYHNGKSEIWMGKALRDGYRSKVFLMTKIDGRSKEEAAKQIDESLLRLETDHVDLMQFHEIIRPHDPDMIFAEGGAFEAMMAAQKDGKTRFVGFTGHKDPYIHLRMLETASAHGFRFDTVQMPLNIMDAQFRSFQQQVLPHLIKNQIGVLAMKSMGSPFIIKSNVVTPMECLHYTMSLPVSVVITGIDKPEILKQALDAVRTYQALTPDQIRDLLQRTQKLAMTQLSSGDDLDRWLASFLDLEESGWKGQAGTAINCDAADREYFMQIMREAFRRERLLASSLRLDGRMIAGQADIGAGVGAFSLKAAYNETYGRFSPGILLTVEIIRQMHRQNAIRWLDSCTAPGEHPTKHLWGQSRLLASVILPVRGWGSQLLVSLIPAVRQVLRRR